ncbi:hypothetical protein ACFL96_19625 [Thermoproteota archaeon]
MARVIHGIDGEKFDPDAKVEVPVLLCRDAFRDLVKELKAIEEGVSDDEYVVIDTFKYTVKVERGEE